MVRVTWTFSTSFTTVETSVPVEWREKKEIERWRIVSYNRLRRSVIRPKPA
jgi:hypothetical protein